MSGKNEIEFVPFKITPQILNEIEQDYLYQPPLKEDLKLEITQMKLRRAIRALQNVMKKRNLNLGVEL